MAISVLATLSAAVKASGTALTVVPAGTWTAQAGDVFLLWGAFDNLSTSTPTMTGTRADAGDLNLTWSEVVSFNSPQASAGAGVRQTLAIATAASAGTVSIAMSLSGAVTAKVGAAMHIRGAGAVLESGASASSLGNKFIALGDLFVHFGASESSAPPSIVPTPSNFAWITPVETDGSSGGSSLTNVSGAWNYGISPDALAAIIVSATSIVDAGHLYAVLDVASTGPVTHSVSGTVAVTSGGSGTPRKIQAVSGAVAITSGSTGGAGTTQQAIGTVATVSGTSGSVVKAVSATGVVPVASAVSGAVTRRATAAGVVAVVSTDTGSVSSRAAVSGAVTTLSTTSGAVTRHSPVSGTVSALSAASGEVTTAEATQPDGEWSLNLETMSTDAFGTYFADLRGNYGPQFIEGGFDPVVSGRPGAGTAVSYPSFAYSGGVDGGGYAGGTQRTIMAWFRIGTDFSGDTYAGVRLGAGLSVFTQLQGGAIKAACGSASTTWIGPALTPGWHHIAMTFNTNVMTLFVDGIAVGSTSATTSVSTSTTLDAYFDTAVDEIRVFHTELSDAEILEWMDTPIAGGVIHSVAGTVAASSGASGSVTRVSLAAGSVPILSGAGGSTVRVARPSGAVAIQSSTSGSTRKITSSAGTVIVVSAAAGSMTTPDTIEGQVAIDSAVAGAVRGIYRVSGTVPILSGALGATRRMATPEGDVVVTSTSSGSVTRIASVAGTVIVVSSIAGSLASTAQASGTVVILSSASGAIQTSAPPLHGPLTLVGYATRYRLSGEAIGLDLIGEVVSLDLIGEVPNLALEGRAE